MDLNTIKQLVLPVLRKYPVGKAGVFGSYALQNARNESDVDILIELTKPISLLDYVGLKLELEDLLQKKVDLVEYRSIKKQLRNSILEQEVRIYG